MSRNLQVFEITKSKWFGQVERYWDDWPVGEWMYRLVPFSSHGAFELKKIHLTESEFAALIQDLGNSPLAGEMSRALRTGPSA